MELSGAGNGNGDWMGILRVRYPNGVPKRLREFWRAYGGEARRDATAAAKMAGYAHPNSSGNRLKAKWPKLVEIREKDFLESCGVKPDELVMHLAEIVRDKDHKDRMKAIETNAKIHGMLTEKTVIELDRTKLLHQIDDRIAQLIQARAIDTGQTLPALVVGDQESDDSS